MWLFNSRVLRSFCPSKKYFVLAFIALVLGIFAGVIYYLNLNFVHRETIGKNLRTLITLSSFATADRLCFARLFFISNIPDIIVLLLCCISKFLFPIALWHIFSRAAKLSFGITSLIALFGAKALLYSFFIFGGNVLFLILSAFCTNIAVQKIDKRFQKIKKYSNISFIQKILAVLFSKNNIATIFFLIFTLSVGSLVYACVSYKLNLDFF